MFTNKKTRLPEYEVNILTKNVGQLNFNNSLANIPSQWTKTKGEGVKIGVLDTGLPNHNDLNHKIVNYKNFTSSKTVEDIEGHSSSVCGIIAAERSNGSGVTGIAPLSSLYVGKVLTDKGVGNDKWLSEGILWCIEQGCHIINMSVGAPASAAKKFKRTKEAIKLANEKGVILFAAAGNDGSHKIDIPARWNQVFCIVAIDREKERAYFSNSGPEVDFSALGVDVVSTYLDQQYASVSGTSFACPVATGIAALILGEDIKKPNREIKNWWDMRAKLISLSSPIKEAPWNPEYGFGNIVFGSKVNTVDPYNKIYGIVEEEQELSLFRRILNFFKF